MNSDLASAHDRLLDCSRAGNFAFWFSSGVFVVLVSQITYLSYQDANWAYLIRVGSESTLRPLIVSELGSVKPTDVLGHDGQMCYAIARDPWDASGTSKLIRHVDPQYRYRRILYPLLSGGLGTFAPRTTLWGLIVWLWVGAGLSAVAVADVAFQHRLSGGFAVANLANPGLLLSAVALTPDALALGFALASVALYLRGRHWGAITLIALATLTKETHVVFAGGMAVDAWLRKQRLKPIAYIAVPLASFAAWSLWCWFHVAHGTSPLHNFTLPGAGIVGAIYQWQTADTTLQDRMLDFALGGLGVGLTGLAAWTALRSSNRVVSICGELWAIISLTTSISVWGEPTNLIRVAAPLWPLVLLNWGEARKSSQRESSAHAEN